MIVYETGQKIDGDRIHRLTKRKIDWSIFNKRKCAKCNSNIITKKTSKLYQRGEYIFIECSLDYKEYKAVLCKRCIPKLNPNSFEYNMAKFGLSEEASRNLIYNRNKSPFYKNNHEDYESYRKFQSHDDFSEERKIEIQKKQNLGRLQWYNNYLEVYGEEAMRKLKDSSSVEYFKERYSDDWEYYFNKKNEQTRKKTHKEILRDDDLIIKYLAEKKCDTGSGIKKHFDRYTKSKSIISKIHLIETDHLTKNSMRYICWKKLYGIESLYEVLDMKKKKEFIEKRVIPGQKGFVYNGNIDGHFLRSGQEIDLYRKLEKSKVKIISTNKSYPDSGRQYYDFLIESDSGEKYFIELVGNDSRAYKDKLLEREKIFGSILISRNHIDAFISDLEENKDVTKEKYNDW